MKRVAWFFIDNPVLAAVLSLLIALTGALALFRLPIAEYPDVIPPEIMVKTVVAGATVDVLEQSVAIPIEERVNGAKDMQYMMSRMANDGSYTLSVIFKPGTDPDLDALEVQTRVLQAQSELPQQVVQNGIEVKKRSPSTLMIVSLFSPDRSRDSLYVSNYLQIHGTGPLTRATGIGDYELHGRTYAMRVWLRPDRMAALGVTMDDVRDALEAQNSQTPPGQIGGAPSAPRTEVSYNVITNSELQTPEAYDDMVIRLGPRGGTMRLRDFGRAELGPRDAGTFTDVNGLPGTSLQIYELPAADSLQTAKQIRETLKQLKKSLEPGLEYAVSLDTTLYVTQSIHDVMQTFLIALLLVLVIVYVFLGTLRATLIPMLAVPVSLIGSLSIFAALGFTINILSLFGLVLAIGLVVDDAIIVVEAVQRHIDEGADPRDAARRAMGEVSRAILAVALVLSFVFIPIAFIPGITGSFYRQFTLAIAASLLISAFVALSLTPALCAVFLKPRAGGQGLHRRLIERFERAFAGLRRAYGRLLQRVIGRWGWGCIVLAAIGVVIGALSQLVPTGFIPSEDQGYFYVTLSMPDGTSLQKTEEISRAAERRLLTQLPGVQYINTLGGYTFLEDSDQPNTTTLILALTPWSKRTGKGMDAESLMKRAADLLADIPEAQVTPQAPAAVPGLGGAGGFTMELEDEAGGSLQHLVDTAAALSDRAAKDPVLDDVYDTVRMDVPQIRVEVDRDKAGSLGVPLDSVFDTMQVGLGGLIVNNFNSFGRVYKTVLQADAEYRSKPEALRDLYVRTSAPRGAKMLPLSNLVTLSTTTGPNVLQHLNLYRSVEISGDAAKGHSSGQALAAMERLAASLPAGIGFQWVDLAYQEEQAAGKALPIFLVVLVFVYLVIAAQFGSWLTPLSVVLAIPTGALGVYLALWVSGQDNTIFTQVGLIAMVGLTAKNAVLIVEFATQRNAAGADARQAALDGAALRFRPIMMTSLAFIFGMLPLVVSSGAESISRRGLGTAILGGMLIGTLLTVFVTPMFFVATEQLAATRMARRDAVTRDRAAAAQTRGRRTSI